VFLSLRYAKDGLTVQKAKNAIQSIINGVIIVAGLLPYFVVASWIATQQKYFRNNKF